MVDMKNISSRITPKLASAFTSVTAGGTGDATAVTGIAIQRSAIGNPLNASLQLAFSAVLAATKTLSFGTVKIQDSADGSTWSNFISYTDPGVVATGPTGGGTVTGVTKLHADLSGARDYVRVLFTPDMSATGTDTATIVAILNLAGFDRLPAA